jgi:hypothetical protein
MRSSDDKDKMGQNEVKEMRPKVMWNICVFFLLKEAKSQVSSRKWYDRSETVYKTLE